MQTVKIDLDAGIAHKLEAFAKLLGSKEILLNEFFEYHKERMRQGIAQMQIDLAQYESKYNMKTEDFYRQFENGAFGDDDDFMLWAGIYELLKDSKNKLEKLA